MARRHHALLTLGLLAASLTSCPDSDPLVPRRDQEIVSRARALLAGTPSTKPDSACSHKSTFYRDADGDGFGDPAKPVQSCGAPPGFVANRDDCYDHNRRARPAQRDFFAVDRGDGSFDYDCDGRSVRRFTTRSYCREKESGGCALASGWVGRKIPACGQPAEFAWKVCRAQVVVTPPKESPDAGVTVHSAGALVPGAKQQSVYRCGGRKLPWKKRQLCR